MGLNIRNDSYHELGSGHKRVWFSTFGCLVLLLCILLMLTSYAVIFGAESTEDIEEGDELAEATFLLKENLEDIYGGVESFIDQYDLNNEKKAISLITKDITWPDEIPDEIPPFDYGRIRSYTDEVNGDKVVWKVVVEEIKDEKAVEKYEALLVEEGWSIEVSLNSLLIAKSPDKKSSIHVEDFVSSVIIEISYEV